MSNLQSKIRNLATQVQDPKTALCEIRWLDDGGTLTANIALHDSASDGDYDIFYYAGSVSGLISLTEAGVEDFIVTNVLSIE
jgi:hypothetical protein